MVHLEILQLSDYNCWPWHVASDKENDASSKVDATSKLSHVAKKPSRAGSLWVCTLLMSVLLLMTARMVESCTV